MATVGLPKLAKDMTGKRFNRLSVVKYIGPGKDGRGSVWLCVCDCGNERFIVAGDLRRGLYQSCGCFVKDVQRERLTTHGKSRSSVYRTWNTMKMRCHNHKNPNYKHYGARGVIVCERWRESFDNFYADMGDRPPKCELERIDNDGPYCKENCRWATRQEQCRNTRQNMMIEYRGQSKCVTEWAEIVGLKPATLRRRLVSGWDVEKAMATPVRGAATDHTS